VFSKIIKNMEEPIGTIVPVTYMNSANAMWISG
jgi:hypothetical protein